MLIHVKRTVEAYQCQKCRKYFKMKQQTENMCKKSTLFFWFLFEAFNILDIFYKIQNLSKWQLVSVITHWTYTYLNPWALREYLLIFLKGQEVSQDSINKRYYWTAKCL